MFLDKCTYIHSGVSVRPLACGGRLPREEPTAQRGELYLGNERVPRGPGNCSVSSVSQKKEVFVGYI